MADHDQGAVVAPRACSSSSMASRSRWLVGSSSSRRLVPRATSTARPARERSPGDSAASGLRRCSAPRSNLASRDRACSTDSSVRCPHRVQQGARARGAVLAEVADDHPRPEPDGALLRAQLAGQQPEQGRLAGAVRPGQGQAVAPAQLQVDRAEPEAAPPHGRPGQASNDLAAAPAGLERQAQVPALPGLLGVAEALQAPLDRLGPGGAGGGPLLAPAGQGLVVVGAPLAPAAGRPLALLAGRLLQPRPLGPGLVVVGVGLLAPAAALLDDRRRSRRRTRPGGGCAGRARRCGWWWRTGRPGRG